VLFVWRAARTSRSDADAEVARKPAERRMMNRMVAVLLGFEAYN
jgi:hypothetical protein